MLIYSNQIIAAKYLYDPFGNTLSLSGPLASLNVYRFASKEWNTSAGIYNFGRRYYDPMLQRFLNRDPLAEQGGINLYAYVGNNPVNLIDTLGLCPPNGLPPWLQPLPNLDIPDLSNLPWYDSLAYEVNGGINELQDTLNSDLPWYIAGVPDTGLSLVGGVLDTPQGLGHLGEGAGTFSANPTWANSAGLFQDISTTLIVVAPVTGAVENSLAETAAANSGGTTLYRVFGNEASGLGNYYTPINPATVTDFRTAAGLYPGNSGSFVLEGTLNNTEGVVVRSAASGPGGVGGGLPEVFVPDPATQININRVSRVNPPF
jgi:RHS repeat-associated protein